MLIRLGAKRSCHVASSSLSALVSSCTYTCTPSLSKPNGVCSGATPFARVALGGHASCQCRGSRPTTDIAPCALISSFTCSCLFIPHGLCTGCRCSLNHFRLLLCPISFTVMQWLSCHSRCCFCVLLLSLAVQSVLQGAATGPCKNLHLPCPGC